MLDKKILKRLIKRKKKENEFLKESSLSFIFFRILALSYFPNTIYPATSKTQQHHNMKSNPNTECIAKKKSHNMKVRILSVEGNKQFEIQWNMIRKET